MTGDEARAARAGTELLGAIPGRLRLWLWVVSLNGAALGVEGIIQRLEGSGRLLFLVQPRVNPAAETQFGPFAYRSNAAQYLNLIWPVTLGLWWWCQQTLRRGTRARRWSHALLGTAIIMAACPIVSTSRAGALVGMMLLAGAVAILITARRADGLLKLGVLGVFGISLAAGAWLGWASLNPRLDDLAEGWRGRELMYQTARVIAAEHPWLGTGPGTFEHIFQIYRQSTDEYWPAQLHNDWLELRLTFGWIGFGMMLAGLSVWVSCAWQKGGIPGSRRFVWLIWLALAGCLVQARWDFPFRVYSIVVLFLLLGSVLTVMGRAGSGR
jgi:O-antigen ligase